MPGPLDLSHRGWIPESPSLRAHRMLTLLFFLGLLGGFTAQAAGQNPILEVAYDYQAPTAPGQPFSFRYAVPDGCLTALFISHFQSDADSDASVDELIEAGSFKLFPLATNDDGTARVDGVLPDWVTGEQVEQAAAAFRVVMFDPTTGECLISQPLVLSSAGEEDSDEDDEESEASATLNGSAKSATTQSSGFGGGSQSQMLKSTGEKDPNNPPTKPTTIASSCVFQGISASGTFGLSALSPPAGTVIATNAHDQPTPVQGSGH